MYRYLFSIAIFMASISASANSPFGPVKIKELGVSDFNMMVVKIESNGDQKHTEQCDPGREETLVINTESPYEKEMFSIALAAHASGKHIKGWANGCHIFGNNYKSPKMTVITIVNQ